jgi:hypothetical protein
MKKISYIILAILITRVSAETWNKSVDANLTLTQNAYSNNWAGTEVGVMSWTFNSNSLLEKQLSAKLNNKNTLKLAFGQTINQVKVNDTVKKWSSPFKSTDLIDFESILRFTLGVLVDPFLSGRVESQFIDMSDTTKYRPINPIKFTEGFGVARTITKQDKLEWNARFGFGFRQNLNRLVTGGNLTTNDGGLEFVTEFKTPFAQERITYSSRLTIFQAMFRSGTPPNNNWKSPDANWENIFTAGITKYLMVNLYTQLLYEKEIENNIQIKETLALGLAFKVL